MKRLFVLLFFIVSPVFAENATPFCTRMSTRIIVRTKVGNPQYLTQYSRKDFLRKAGVPNSPYTLGLTVAKLDVTAAAKPSLSTQYNEICVGIKEIDIEMSYPDLTVYIDKKYPPSSCEYQTIKEHEDYHVNVAQQALSFFKPDVEKLVYDEAAKIVPQVVYSKDDIQPTVNKQVNIILSALQPLIQHINKKLSEKNAAIDTPEMYKATTAVCHNW